MRRGLLGVITACALVFAPGAVWAQSDEDASGASGGGGSLAAQLLSAADESLGEDATLAVLRAFDRGYEVLQVVEAIAGRIEGNTASVKAGVAKSILDVSVENDDTICGDLILDTAKAWVSTVTVGPFDLKLKKGATAEATGTVLGARYEATISLR